MTLERDTSYLEMTISVFELFLWYRFYKEALAVTVW